MLKSIHFKKGAELNPLAINKNYFRGGGVIGRWDFFVSNTLYSLGFAIVGMLLLGALGKIFHPIVGVAGFTGVFAVSFYFGFINMYKRLRDIRGTKEHETSHQIFLTIGICFPVIGGIVGLWLLFMPGQITRVPERNPVAPDNFKNAA